MTMQRFFYLKQNGRIIGPFAAAQLLQKYRAGFLDPGDQISPDKENWTDAIEFFTGGPKEEPAPATSELIFPQETVSLSVPVSGEGCDIPKIVVHDVPGMQTQNSNEIHNAENCKSSAGTMQSRNKATPIMFGRIVGILFLVTLLGGGILYFCFHGISLENVIPEHTEKKKDWQTIIENSKEAVGVVLLEVTAADGENGIIPMGTTWAYSDHSFVTNAHVIESLYGSLADNNGQISSVKVYVAMDSSHLRHEIHSVQIHPGYIEGEAGNSDFAVLHTNDTLKTKLQCAEKDVLKKLRQGDEVIYLGFPMEGLHRENLNLEKPMATMQLGNITAISDVNLGDNGFEKNVLIRHNLPTVGGASGSPIFASNGNVIAILNAGNMNFEYENDGITLKKREASAAMINFAIRIDRLEPCLHTRTFTMDQFLKGQ